jgi:hypothetical protein
LVSLVLMAPVLALPVTTASPAAADPKPDEGQSWPMCGVAPDDDGQFCVVSVTRNGVAPESPPIGDGEWEEPYVDLIGPGDVRFGVYHWVRVGSDLTLLGDVDPTAEWVLVVNTGPVRTREVYGHIRDVSLSFGGDAVDGWTFTLTLKPTPIAWLWDESGWLPCSYDGGCGDDATVAGLVYAGFVTGYVTDDAGSGMPPSMISDRTGYINAYNAQDAYSFYDPTRNAMVVRMANPHLALAGPPPVEAIGFYETFLPDAMLVNEFGVPDPGSLTGGSFTVRRSGSSVDVPFTLTHEPGGVRIKIDAITFSTPEFKIKPHPSRPGVPRWGSVTRLSAHAVTVRFRAPVADGGAAHTKYTARCRRGDATWLKASGTGSPLTVRGVPRKPVTCQVRAVNRIGPSLWSATRTG